MFGSSVDAQFEQAWICCTPCPSCSVRHVAVMDSAARSSIIDLIESATDRNAEAPGPAAARDRQLALLALLSKGDAYVDVAHSTLQTKLQAKHALVGSL